jgi:transitional endoplasmic reticulum ATPase
MFDKGNLVAGKYSIQFPISENRVVSTYRAKDKNRCTVRLDLINLASLSSSYFDEENSLINNNLIKTLYHPNLLKMIDHGETTIGKQRFAYRVYKYEGNESIKERMKRETVFSSYSAIPLILYLLDVLKYLQNRPDPVIHNGLSPESIFLDYSEHKEKPILTSFENARKLSQTENPIPFRNLSLFYAAPEVMNGIYIPQSDIFSLGGVLYYLITGIPPFYDEKVVNQPIDKQKKLMEQLRNRPLDFSLADSNLIDDHLENTIIKSLSFNFRDRFQSPEEFERALKREVTLDHVDSKSQRHAFEQPQIKKDGGGFAQIAGMDEIKLQLKEDVIDYLHDPDLYKKYGIPMLNGILLYGPPGCGKTFISQKFAEEVGYNFVMIKPSDLQSRFVNATQENIGKLFKEAEQKAPTIIFIDELDAIVPTREGELHQMHAAAVNEILAQMTNCGERGIFVIAATNRPERIDPAILRTGRLDKHFYIPPPDFNARVSMFKLYLKDRPIDLSLDYDDLSAKTNNYVASDIKFLIDQASIKALKLRSRITMGIFEEVIQSNLPSVTLSEIRKYDEFRKKWEFEKSGVQPEKEKPKFGFNE